jgi:hypothetical protein
MGGGGVIKIVALADKIYGVAISHNQLRSGEIPVSGAGPAGELFSALQR